MSRPIYVGKEPRYPLTRRLGETQSRSRRFDMKNNSLALSRFLTPDRPARPHFPGSSALYVLLYNANFTFYFLFRQKILQRLFWNICNNVNLGSPSEKSTIEIILWDKGFLNEAFGVFLNVCHPEVLNTYINIQWCISQTQRNFIMFISVLGQRVSILIESSSGPSKIQILT